MIEERIETMLKKFNSFETWEDKYRMILHYGKKLESLDDSQRIDDNLVPGCLSRVWLDSKFEDDRVYYYADSDAAITKGIIGLLLNVYSGLKPDEILSTPPDFLQQVGIDQHLSMNRRNGLVNMCKLIFAKAMQYQKQ